MFDSKIHCEYYAPSILRGTVGLMSKSWVNEFSSKKPYSYRFGTGSYYSTNKLLLVDDIFEWAHRRIDSKDVRSAFDIIIAIKEGKLLL